MNKCPNISIYSANVQGLLSDRKRLSIFSTYAHSSSDLFLLSETGHPDALIAAQWTEECKRLGLSSIFLPNNNTAILWKDSSPISRAPAPPPSLTSSLPVFRYGRATDAALVIGEATIIVVAVYIPVEGRDRKPYLVQLSSALSALAEGSSLVVGGDWNCVEDPQIDSSNPSGANVGERELKKLLAANSLVDAYRLRAPRRKEFTNDGGTGADRRLDRFYISPDLIELVKSFSIYKKPPSSTHCPIGLRLFLPGAVEKGPGKFKLGLHTLKREGMDMYLTTKIQQLHYSSLLAHPADPIAAWARTKALLLPHLQGLSRQLASFDRQGSSFDADAHAQESASVRARLDPSLTGSSSVQIRLLQVRAADLIPSLRVGEEEVKDADGILGAARDFYAGLYGEKEIEEAALEQILGELERHLSPADARSLEVEFTEEELTAASTHCQRNSSAGPDGLPLEFYLATWTATGPILLSLINHIPTRPPSSLPSSEAHIHLIHKKGAHDQLGNKRPISLINADERILSQAHNQRLAPLLPSIIDPSQTGFIPGRHISTNIEQLQCAMDTGKECPGLIAALDFEKAYDRLSHSYLDAVLKAVGVGPRARRWYAATYLNQTAKVFVNGWLSLPLPILSGVRQGDPLAPSIFAIAIEAFACAVRRRVKGITSLYLPTFVASLFADDAAVGLGGYSDVPNLKKAVDLYERASGSRLSAPKTFLYALGQLRVAPRPSCGGWRVTTEPFRYLGVQVGVEVDREKEWAAAKARVVQRMRGIPMFDLPLATRCSIINRFCYSKILYLDQFSPAPDHIIEAISSTALDVLWGKKSHSISPARLATPLDRGGFGLVDLHLQLLGPRAAWIFSLLPSSSWDTRYLRAIRCVLWKVAEQQPIYRRDDPQHNASTSRRWTGLALLCRPSEGALSDWRKAVVPTLAALPARWRAYLSAWNDYVSLVPRLTSKQVAWNVVALHPRLLNAAAEIPLNWFRAPGNPNKPISAVSFARTTEALTLREYGVIVPRGWEKEFKLGKGRWKAWWAYLRKFRRFYSDAEDTAHRLSLYNLKAGKHLFSAAKADLFPNNTSPSCTLCLLPHLETHHHLFVDCEVAQRIWELGCKSTYPHPPLVDLVCPTTRKSRVYRVELAFRVVFIDTIWSLERRRRFGATSPLEPLTEKDIERLGVDLYYMWDSASSQD